MGVRAVLHVIFAASASAAPAHIPSAKLEPDNAVTAQQAARPHGLAFSGGSFPGLMNSMSVLHAMERYGVTPNADTTDDSTNSGGSLGHTIWVTNHENIEFPDVESGPWEYKDLDGFVATTKPYAFNAVQGVAKFIPGKATTSSKVTELAEAADDDDADTTGISADEFLNLAVVSRCLISSLVVGGHESLWYCIAWALLGQYNVHPFNVKPGPRPWHLQFTAYNSVPNGGYATPFPITPGSDADAATLTKGINVCQYNVATGDITSAGSFDVYTERYLNDAYDLTPSQIGKLANLLNMSASALGAENSKKLAADAFAATHTSSAVAVKTKVDLPYVVPFSTSFMSMGIGLAKADGTPCPVKSPLGTLGVSRDEYNYGMHLKTSNGYATITDGGDMDTTAVNALLRMKKKKILTVMDGPYNITTKYGILFGVAEAPHDCSAHHALMSVQKVFDPARWPEVKAALTDKTNKGVHVFKNMAVQANPWLGVEAYTIDQLVIFDNQSKEPFEQEMFTPEALTQLKSYTGKKPAYPCDQTKNTCGMSGDKAMAAALSLMFQWKVKNNLDILKDVFDL